MYQSKITFTIDTVCPWTYISKKRLDKALEIVRSTNPPVTFTPTIEPFQLEPSFSADPVSKSDYYASLFGERFADLASHVVAIGQADGINFKFGGTLVNTLPAHAVLQAVRAEKGDDKAWEVLGGLYRRYFEEEQSPASVETLEAACVEAGLGEGWATGVLEGGEARLEEVRKAARGKRAEGVDAVPHVVLEGRKRDIKLVGAKEVNEYVKALETIIKESQ